MVIIMPQDPKKSTTITDLQEEITQLNSALMNRPTLEQINQIIDIAIGQFGDNPALVTNERMRAVEKQLAVVLERMLAITSRLNNYIKDIVLNSITADDIVDGELKVTMTLVERNLLADFDAQLIAINVQIQTLTTDLSDANTNIDSIITSISVINSQLASITSQLSSINTQITSINSQLVSIDSTITILQNDVSALTASVTAIEVYLSSLSTSQVSEDTDKRYVTDEDLLTLSNQNLLDIKDLSLVLGDIIFFDGTNLVKLGIGPEDNILKVTSGVPAWGAGGGGGGSGREEQVVEMLASDLNTAGGTIDITLARTFVFTMNTNITTPINFSSGLTEGLSLRLKYIKGATPYTASVAPANFKDSVTAVHPAPLLLATPDTEDVYDYIGSATANKMVLMGFNLGG